MTAQSPARPRAGNRKIVVLLVLLVTAVAASRLFDLDIGGWIAAVLNDVREIPPAYIIVACIIKGFESVLVAFAWRSILQAAYPEQPISFRLVLGAYQGGVGINAITPANAGTWLMIGLYRLRIKGASIASILSAALVQNLMFSVLAVITWGALLLGMPTARETIVDAFEATISFLHAHPILLWTAVAAIVVAVVIGARWIWRRATALWAQARRGGAILRTPRRYLSHVALPQAVSYFCRWGVTVTFLAAFDIPVTPRSVFLVIGSNTLANAVQVAPGGIGTTQAILIVALRNYASAETVTAYSLAQSSILTIWNVAFGFIALALAFGITGAKDIVLRRHRISAQTQEVESSGRADLPIEQG